MALGVVANRDRGYGTNLNFVALVLDLTFPIVVGDFRQYGGLIELDLELARPNLGDELTCVFVSVGGAVNN